MDKKGASEDSSVTSAIPEDEQKNLTIEDILVSRNVMFWINNFDLKIKAK